MNHYLTLLDEAWKGHCAERDPHAPTVISTFAGGGGSSLGYSMAGFRELLAVEWDAHAVDTFRMNFPGVPVYHGDISNLTVEDVLKRTGLAPGELDVFDGSPPCQGFSMVGKRQYSDDRNQLFREYIRLLHGLRPRVFVMENVPGMAQGRMKLIFADILRQLKAAGYKVSARLMTTSYFHVPQNRKRIIFIGVRDDLGIDPSHPRAQAHPFTMRTALEGVMHEDVPSLCPKYRRLAPAVQSGECAADHDNGKGFSSIQRPYWDRPCLTITKTNNGAGIGTILHPEENRSLSIPEAKRLCSYPDPYRMEGKFVDRWARLGNSVPPLFMRAIAEHIRREILKQ